MDSLEELKARYTIEDAWRDEGLSGSPQASCKSPFREDRKASFSVFSDFRYWKDHATGESGDVFRFIQKARNCDFPESLKIVQKRIGKPYLKAFQSQKKYLNKSNSVLSAPLIPSEIRRTWTEGIEFLRKNPQKASRIDSWRGWPEGTTQELSDSGFIGMVKYKGKRFPAFPVHKITNSGLQEIGIHLRFSYSGKSNWFFLPNKKNHNQKTPPLPFILGVGHLKNAQFIAITEGQWDAISFAAWNGWLSHNTAWPDNCVVIGIRGSGNWKLSLDCLWWPQTCKISLFIDNDNAGRNWKKGFLEKLKERSEKVTVITPETGDLSDQLKNVKDKTKELKALLERSMS